MGKKTGDLGFGRCVRCPKWAVIAVYGHALCQKHFEADLKITRELFTNLLKTLKP